MRTVIAFAAIAILGLSGCGAPAKPAVANDTGSRAVVDEYFGAFIKKDWTTAYGRLSAANRRACDIGRFARWAEAQRKRIGFEPDKVHIASCEESGARAIAHVTFTGNRHHAHFKDAATLAFEEGIWRVSLPAQFERKPVG